MRLSQYLAHAGIASRRQAEGLITEGKVKVNGVVVTTLGTRIDPEFDQVEYNNQIIKGEPKIYLLLNKPSGYLCSVRDSRGRPTVMDLVPQINQRIYPVGRLDYESEGLLLMSNDGYFTNLMIHPRYKIDKQYEVLVKGRLTPADARKLAAGIELDDGLTAPAKVQLLKTESDLTLIRITIHEGRKRQVRRMCSAIGHDVVRLKRTAFGFLTLDGVPQGKYRLLLPGEIKRLVQLARGGPYNN
ncbi:MAG: pseudouridine synthase [Syntrophomonadaceae bacterium]|jgi:23S rRNA pseudouridine2605 synthase